MWRKVSRHEAEALVSQSSFCPAGMAPSSSRSVHMCASSLAEPVGAEPMAASNLARSPRYSAASGSGFTFGIEEEYFLGDAETFLPPEKTPEAIFRPLRFGGVRLERELLQS